MLTCTCIRRMNFAVFCLILVTGCGGPVEQSADSRELAAKTFTDGDAAFAQRDFASAGEHFTQAIEHGLSADRFAEAAVKRAICWGSNGKHVEAHAELDKLEAAAPNQDEILAARSYILAKQGKAAESRVALAKARQLNRTVQPFKD